MARTHTVEITCSNGDFTYDPHQVRLRHGEQIRWVCTDPSMYFTVHIGWHSPFDKGRYQAQKGGEIVAMVPPHASPGVFKYFVAAFDGSKIWTDDPEFVIRG